MIRSSPPWGFEAVTLHDVSRVGKEKLSSNFTSDSQSLLSNGILAIGPWQRQNVAPLFLRGNYQSWFIELTTICFMLCIFTIIYMYNCVLWWIKLKISGIWRVPGGVQKDLLKRTKRHSRLGLWLSLSGSLNCLSNVDSENFHCLEFGNENEWCDKTWSARIMMANYSPLKC